MSKVYDVKYYNEDGLEKFVWYEPCDDDSECDIVPCRIELKSVAQYQITSINKDWCLPHTNALSSGLAYINKYDGDYIELYLFVGKYAGAYFMKHIPDTNNKWAFGKCADLGKDTIKNLNFDEVHTPLVCRLLSQSFWKTCDSIMVQTNWESAPSVDNDDEAARVVTHKAATPDLLQSLYKDKKIFEVKYQINNEIFEKSREESLLEIENVLKYIYLKQQTGVANG